jgi:hypothetical protein
VFVRKKNVVGKGIRRCKCPIWGCDGGQWRFLKTSQSNGKTKTVEKGRQRQLEEVKMCRERKLIENEYQRERAEGRKTEERRTKRIKHED